MVSGVAAGGSDFMIECHPPRWEISVFLVACSIIEAKSSFTYTLALLNSSFSESLSMLELTHVSVGSLSLYIDIKNWLGPRTI